ncbi:hypothetical protein [Streptomyces yatensis]|uniref:Uncharacterized protein n=1 Tax=Streptomyces yatensis TaxID=155177 RepID=A0ABN2JBT0_9ACTN|nr:hypothetical protein [Streptomyces yatensis]
MDLAPRDLPRLASFLVDITTGRAFPEKRPRLVDNDLSRWLPASGAGAFFTTSVRFAFDQQFTPRAFLTRHPGRDRPREIEEGGGVPRGPELSFRLHLRTAVEGGLTTMIIALCAPASFSPTAAEHTAAGDHP